VNTPGDGSTQVPPGAFAAAGDRWTYTGALTLDNAAAVVAAAAELPLPASGRVDLAGLGHADSVALAVLLAIRRRAADEKRSLAFEAVPAGLESLARVYGIDELLLSAPAHVA
jgi:phospholipid transport system transporter-binding protein